MSLIQIRIICRYAITIFIVVTRKKANNKNKGLLQILSIENQTYKSENDCFSYICISRKSNAIDPLELLSITNNTTNVGYIVFHT